ncbi:Hypp4982 [Branchiostoma lanceolatum]|uniref:Hypp4982 protein n=1 Tax=Branchiostoma lanceolatum TaxID=7740 RepID=A0A8K0AEA0_BRALA|nr:Hypp4982 [Branchiostoma lanceolatum]
MDRGIRIFCPFSAACYSPIYLKYHEELHQQREEFKDLTTQYNNLKDEHNTLQAKVDNLEQYSRRNCVIISGIPESPGERSTDNSVLSVANDKLKCDPQLTINDIDRSHRLGKPRGDGKPRPIIAKFCSYRSKATIMRAKATTSGRAVLRENGDFCQRQPDESQHVTPEGRPITRQAELTQPSLVLRRQDIHQDSER